MIKCDIIATIEKLPIIALAVSGGSDSMAMAEWFRQNRPIESFVILNIDHHIRGEESRADSEFVKNYAQKHGIKYYHYDVYAVEYAKENGYTLEQSARILRHKVFEQACIDYAYAVATAHHQGDQAESIFMHIARGAGIDGLIGMSCFDGHILRPFIDTPKSEIMSFVKANNLDYCEDRTNEDVDFARNYTRKVIFPTICEKFENFPQSLIKLSNRAKEYADFIDQNTPALYLQDNSVKCDLQDKHIVICAEILRRAFSLLGVTTDIEERHINLLLEFFKNKKSGSLDMPYNTIAYKEEGFLVLSKKIDYQKMEYSFGEGIFELGGFEVCVQKCSWAEIPFKGKFANSKQNKVLDKTAKDDIDFKQESGCDLFINVENLQNVVIRSRSNGDKLAKFGGGTKSLGDFLTDKKVPQRLKNRLPIIANKNNVLCVCGVEIASTAKVDERSKNIYKITTKLI